MIIYSIVENYQKTGWRVRYILPSPIVVYFISQHSWQLYAYLRCGKSSPYDTISWGSTITS